MSLFGGGASSTPNPGQTGGFNTGARSMSFSAGTSGSGFSFGAPSNAAPQSQAGSLFGSAPSSNPSTNSFANPSSNNNTALKPGGLFGQSAPTSTAGSGLFGQSTTQASKPGGGLFGQGTQANNTGSGGGLFGQTNIQTNNTSGGLFGQSSTQPTTASGGLFGQNMQAPNTGGNLFGQSTKSNNTGGGLFGQNTQPSSTGTGLFGQSTMANSTGTGLFGQSTTQPNTSAGGLFGGQLNTQSSNAGGSLFGQSTKQPGTTGGVSFGQNMTSNTANVGSGSGLFGSKPAAPTLGISLSAPLQNTSPLMQYAYYQRERYNELPDAQRALLDSMEKFITSQVQIKHELRARNSSESMRQLLSSVQELMSEQQALAAVLEADSIRLQSMLTKVEQDRNDNAVLHQVAMHARDKLSDGSSFVDWLRRFYERVSNEYVARIQRYRLTMEQLERHLLSADQREQFAPQVISDIIHEQNVLFMALAEQVATLHAEIDMLKKDYVKWYQTRFHSVRDPFAPVAAAATATATDRP